MIPIEPSNGSPYPSHSSMREPKPHLPSIGGSNGAANGTGPRLAVRKPKAKKPRSSKRWELFLWAAVLALFALLSLWHAVALVIRHSSEGTGATFSSRARIAGDIDRAHVQQGGVGDPGVPPLPQPHPLLPPQPRLHPLHGLPSLIAPLRPSQGEGHVQVYAVDPYIPRLFNWTVIRGGLEASLERTPPNDFWAKAWDNTASEPNKLSSLGSAPDWHCVH